MSFGKSKARGDCSRLERNIFYDISYLKINARHFDGAQLILASPSMFVHPTLCGKAHLLQFLRRYVIQARALSVVASIFDLTKIYHAVPSRNNVNLAHSGAPILFNYFAALPL